MSNSGQISYDLRRLRAHQIIERIPHSRNYQLNRRRPVHPPVLHPADQAHHHPALAEIASAGPPPGSALRHADRAYKTAIADLASQASLGIQPRPVTKHRSPHAPVVTHNPS